MAASRIGLGAGSFGHPSRLLSSDYNGKTWPRGDISAGCWVRFLPDRIELGDRPDDGFAFDARGWHDYRLVRQDGEIAIFADGVEKLRAPIGHILRANKKAGVAHVASKFGQTELTQTINEEERENDIRASAIFPGDIETTILKKRLKFPTAEACQRMLRPKDVAECALLALAPPESGYRAARHPAIGLSPIRAIDRS